MLLTPATDALLHGAFYESFEGIYEISAPKSGLTSSASIDLFGGMSTVASACATLASPHQ